MSSRHLLTSLMVDFVETIGERLQIEFRNGTGKGGIPYKTNQMAHAVLFAELDNFNERINAAIIAYRNDGRHDLQQELKQLLDIKEPDAEE